MFGKRPNIRYCIRYCNLLENEGDRLCKFEARINQISGAVPEGTNGFIHTLESSVILLLDLSEGRTSMRRSFRTPNPQVTETNPQKINPQQVRWNEAALGVLLRGWHLSLLLKANFNPTQPRLPSGGSGGGRWTDDGHEAVSDNNQVRVVQTGPRTPRGATKRSFLIDLRDHEGVNGGHAIEKHVGKSDTYLYNRMIGEKFDGKWISMGLLRSGSFDNIVAANKLVSATLTLNRTIVERVARGELNEEFVVATFRYRTGHEFYRDVPTFSFFRPKDVIREREVNGVGVLIVHDPTASEGFRIHTAYPRTDD